ncbi:hypothetical protein BHU72_06595 [Desulfuribacillus stibiiarsenatis]|uniref:Uncharacterized protein n=1 Tax=Desulfuribacillus stibiiarsenatis TaxID=1390249 RepID=A0A1E5L3Y3_9FIRM|nr:FAD-dependent monooxygenase [Desulfuribacillus stibiiarsenatis]OEH84858.1 hypothetical protein BHU72_06595 [Desulfuribacillus stibiiarsenatis]
MLKISNIKLPIGHDSHALLHAIIKELKVNKEQIQQYQILKRSLDARKKDQLHFVYQVVVTCQDERKILQNKRLKNIEPYQETTPISLNIGDKPMQHRPVIVGSGPAGLMAGIILAEYGYRPIILERGKDVDRRAKDIDEFWQTGKLNPESNIQFGEGGAGTFSDGKLTTRIRDTRIDHVYDYLIKAGAPEEISYINKPHIGTDILRNVVKSLRDMVLNAGGEIRFEHKVVDIELENQKVVGVHVHASDKHETTYIETNHVILAIGHSARDTFHMLNEKNVAMDPKSLAIGVRIEHPQTMVNQSQYGEYYDHKDLGAAEYQLVRKKDESLDRTVYSFCMCPGGIVVAAASEDGGVVTNGMSYHARDLQNANSALVVNIDPEDYGFQPGKSPLLGLEYLRKWERQAYEVGGRNFFAPAQLVRDFLEGQPTTDLSQSSVIPSYKPGVTPADLRECLPEFVIDALKQAIRDFGKRMPGFDFGDAILTGIETRTSSPLRIHRKESGESINTAGLYPTGEGAGYAGGIISAAVDGLKIAESMIQSYSNQSFQ